MNHDRSLTAKCKTEKSSCLGKILPEELVGVQASVYSRTG
jgi:hypothetical protein